MEMHQLRYFVSVARIGNFSRAAEHCHVAQPSLSQQIQKLEEELGQRLFDRLGRQTRLTPAGELLLARALRVLDEVEAAKREAQETGSLVRGTITVGILPTIAPYLLPAALGEFLNGFPGVEVHIREEQTGQLVRQLANCEIDLAIATLPFDARRATIQELFEEDLLLALPPEHPLGRRKKISIDDLAEERWIVMQDGHCLGDQVLRFCDRSDVKARVGFRSAQLETLQAIVHAGLGISLVPEMAARSKRSEHPTYRRLESPRPRRTVIAAWPAQRAPGRAAIEFLKAVKSTIAHPIK